MLYCGVYLVLVIFPYRNILDILYIFFQMVCIQVCLPPLSSLLTRSQIYPKYPQSSSVDITFLHTASIAPPNLTLIITRLKKKKSHYWVVYTIHFHTRIQFFHSQIMHSIH